MRQQIALLCASQRLAMTAASSPSLRVERSGARQSVDGNGYVLSRLWMRQQIASFLAMTVEVMTNNT